MKILHHTSVIDGRANSGTARIAKDVITSLSKIEEIHQFFIHYEDSNDTIYGLPRTKEIRLRRNKNLKYRFIYFLIYAFKIRFFNTTRPSKKIVFDVSHWHVFRVYPFFWLIPSKKHIITMHDAGHFLLPHTQTLANKLFILNIKLNLSKIYRIIVLSENAKDNLVKYAKIHGEKVEVIYPSTKFNKIAPTVPSDINSLIHTNKLIVCNSRWQKHKNIENLISGFNRFMTSSEDKNFILLLAGQPRQDYSMPLDLFNQSIWKNQIKIFPNLSDSELAWLYDHSLFSVFPSLHEGFGLPVLESMSRGCPAVVDKNTATNEIVGEGGVATDMRSVVKISEILKSLTNDENYVSKLRIAAIKRSLDFDWSQSVDKLVLMYS